MQSNPTDLSETEAQLLMSQLMDGELSSPDADRLNDYLEQNPGAIEWMESNQLAENATHEAPEVDVASAWKDIERSINRTPHAQKDSGKIIWLPVFYRAMGAAAAIAVMGSLVWMNFRGPPEAITERYAASESVVEFVDTGIPDASPVVYTDEASGWTVVWVTEMEPMPDAS